MGRPTNINIADVDQLGENILRIGRTLKHASVGYRSQNCCFELMDKSAILHSVGYTTIEDSRRVSMINKSLLQAQIVAPSNWKIAPRWKGYLQPPFLWFIHAVRSKQ